MARPVSLGTPVTPGTPGTQETTFNMSGELNGRGVHVNPNLAGLPEDPKTREQILRERYMKGLKKRKCTVCGNTARARCPFRACKTCCSRARNACSVHVLKSATKNKPEGTIVHPSYNAPPSGHAEQPWLAATLQASMGSSYLRPGYSVPSPYNIPTPIGLGMGHPTPVDTSAVGKNYATSSSGARPWVASSILEQQEAQRLKSLRIANQKEAYMTNTWRLQKIKEHAASEILAEDEAFDRYVSNASLLEEIFALRTGPLKGLTAAGELLRTEGTRCSEDEESKLDESIFLDAMRGRPASNSKRKDASRQKLKQVIDKALLRLRKPGQEPSEVIVEDDESALTAGVSVARLESKRFKAQTAEGKQSLKRTEAFDMLLQKLNHAKNQESLQECVDLYKSNLGHDLSHLLPHISTNQEASSCARDSPNGKDTADGSLASPLASQVAQLNTMGGATHASSAAEHEDISSRVSLNNGNVSAPAREVGSTGLSMPEPGATPVNKMNERPSEGGSEYVENTHWHRDFVRGVGHWKVLASEDTIYSMCADADTSFSAIQHL
ncbi:hypothetical protein Mapa_006551 [Marchantia paleacea]|nr:hypothetical protein Mapa_006551 [Marchantia paleacea]